MAVVVGMLRELRLDAENHVDYKYEYYSEQSDRIQVLTQSALFETEISPSVSLKGLFVFDGISGATPDGGPPLSGSTKVNMVQMHDARYAGTLTPSFKFGPHTFQPQLAVSVESDYQSIVPSLNYLYDFNHRNTTLNLGLAHNFDRDIRGIYLVQPQQRDSTDLMAGVTQTFTPLTLLNVTLTLGTASGYLSDPYKGFRFTEYPVATALFPEQRPGNRTKQIISATLTQFVEPLDGSAELTYRFYHDSFGVLGHTATLGWFQNIGRFAVLSPFFRYYQQSAADFYLLSFPADPSDVSNPDNAFIPPHYSSDYRLSRLRTITAGLGLLVRVRQWLYLDAAYQYYEMTGLDGVTSASNYPKANVYTLGLRLRF